MAVYKTNASFRTDAATIGYLGSLIKSAASHWVGSGPPLDVIVAYATAVADAAEHYAFSPTDPSSYWPGLALASATQDRLERMHVVAGLLEGPVQALYGTAVRTTYMIRAAEVGGAYNREAGALPNVSEDERMKIEAYWRFFDVVGKRAPSIVRRNPEIAEAFSALWFAGAKDAAVKYARESVKLIRKS